MKDPREMDEDEWAMHMARLREKGECMRKGVRHDPVIGGDDDKGKGVSTFKPHKRRRLSFREWFDRLPKKRKN